MILRLISSIVIFFICFSIVLTQDNALLLSNLEIITSQNASRITEIANLGPGTYGLPFWAADSQGFYFPTTAGTWLYPLNDITHPQQIDAADVPLSPDLSLLLVTPEPEKPINISPDGRYSVYQFLGDVSGTIYLEIEDKLAGQTIKNIHADEPGMRTYFWHLVYANVLWQRAFLSQR